MGHQIEITDADPAALECMIEFFYTGKSPTNIESVTALLGLTDRYQVDSMFEECIHKAFSSLDCDNVAAIIRAIRPLAQRSDMQVLWAQLCDSVACDPKLQSSALMTL